MGNLKEFRMVNGLTQTDVAEYLGGGVSKAFISQIEHGGRKMPSAQLAKLIHNDMGWDVEPLLDQQGTVSASAINNSTANVNINSSTAATQVQALMKEIEMLRAQLAEEKARSEKYWEMIQKLMK